MSILTTVPVTMSPSSNATMVASMASENDWPPRSSKTTGVVLGDRRRRRLRAGRPTWQRRWRRGRRLRCSPFPTRGRVPRRRPPRPDPTTELLKDESRCAAWVRDGTASASGAAPGGNSPDRLHAQARRRPTSSSSGRSRSGGATSYFPGDDAVDAVDVDAGAAREQLELPRREARRPEIEGALLPVGVAHGADLVAAPRSPGRTSRPSSRKRSAK